jgi:Leucine-rich repeat (LRR) protein
LSYNQIKRIDSIKTLYMLWKISYLNLNYNQIDDIEVLINFININQLFLNGNNITNIESIQSSRIYELELIDNRIENILAIKDLKTLTKLIIANNKIKEIPNHLFDNLTALSELNLSGNKIKYIDSLDCHNKNNFILLDLSKNELENVDFLLDCKTIREIKVNNNKIKYISDKIFSHFYLRTIDLSFNPIDDTKVIFNDEIGENLETLFLDVNSSKSFKNLSNNRLIKQNEKSIFYKALYILLDDRLNHIDCQLQLDFLKKNILLNLFYSYQADIFLMSCTNHFKFVEND